MSDQEAIDELRKIWGGNRETTVLHYMYFPARRSAEAAAGVLTDKGFAVESRLGADGVNWLVLARHRMVPDEARIERHRAMLQVLASQGEGEYDGWEAEVG